MHQLKCLMHPFQFLSVHDQTVIDTYPIQPSVPFSDITFANFRYIVLHQRYSLSTKRNRGFSYTKFKRCDSEKYIRPPKAKHGQTSVTPQVSRKRRLTTYFTTNSRNTNQWRTELRPIYTRWRFRSQPNTL